MGNMVPPMLEPKAVRPSAIPRFLRNQWEITPVDKDEEVRAIKNICGAPIAGPKIVPQPAPTANP